MSVRRSGLQRGKSSVPLRFFDSQPSQSSYNAVRVRLNAVVVMTILDGFSRRAPHQEISIGTLLGTITEGNIVEVTDCFFDHYTYNHQATMVLQLEHHDRQFEQKQNANSSEKVVGLFCTGSEVTRHSKLLADFFRTSPKSPFIAQPPLNEPLCLIVDTEVKEISEMIKVYMQFNTKLTVDTLGFFYRVPVELHNADADSVGLAVATKMRKPIIEELGVGRVLDNSSLAPFACQPPPPDGFQASLALILSLLEQLKDYADGAANGTGPADVMLGRAMSKALCTQPDWQGGTDDAPSRNSADDQVMAAYLVNVAHLQTLMLAKLNVSQ
eukprot:Selendium_serpulae@DN4946_c0_g2_i4.p2